MNHFYELEGLTCTMERESVFRSINCYESSPAYEDIRECYDTICDEICALAKPVGILGFGILPKSAETPEYKEGTPVIYAVTSIGGGISQASTNAFARGDYVTGMLCDAMADEALFSMEKQLIERLKEACQEHRKGILTRLEAPHDIPMEVQKTVWEYLELKRRFGIEISSGYMLNPVKTSCQVFVLTEDPSVFHAEHDCRKCPNIHCRLRNIPDKNILVRQNGQARELQVKEQESLLDALIRHGYYVSAVCGGTGRCGKCRVQIIRGQTRITKEDLQIFSRDELAAGWRLACHVHPQEDLEIAFARNDESLFEVLTAHQEEKAEAACEEDAYDIAIDLGTTTIAMQLLGKRSQKVIHTVTMVNEQRVYGADVISRIKSSIEGKKQELQNRIRRNLLDGMERLLQERGISQTQLKRIVISGNTTMGHLLMGYDCDTLGVFPFTPVNIHLIRGAQAEILGRGPDTETTLLPGISTYVGGDIVSGLYACGFESQSDICLLIDLGTNGEMALGNKDKILVASAAAGPAFEGGAITWGMGSVAGAICSVMLCGTRTEIRTIREQAPEGICGTGVIELTAELVREGIVSDSGALDPQYFSEGFPLAKAPDGRTIVFTQKDIREIQLAKAAVRAGLETLLLRYGISKNDVAKIYLSGGFGYRLDTGKAIAIGMLPEEFSGRIEPAGNSSLAGAIKYLKHPDAEAAIQRLIAVSEEISLSLDPDFNERYLDSMFFEAD